MIVGSLFSKRPRVAGSNCRISCFAGGADFSAGAFSSFHEADFSCGLLITRSGSPFRVDITGSSVEMGIAAGAASAATGSGNGTVSSTGTDSTPGCSNWISDCAGDGWYCSRTGDATDAPLGTGGACSKAASSSAESELMIVTLKRSPSRPSTTVPKRICV
jgi:hypothetical protein